MLKTFFNSRRGKRYHGALASPETYASVSNKRPKYRQINFEECKRLRQ